MDDATGHQPYTPEQQKTLESGLRILARMVVRAHLRRRGTASTLRGGSKPEPDVEGGGSVDGL